MPTIRPILELIYGGDVAAQLYPRLMALLDERRSRTEPLSPLTERDAILITYGDMVSTPGVTPLKSLTDFLNAHARDLVSTVHILPFFPYSSDDGFSVIDYAAVDPALGTWEDIARMRGSFRLMFDAVINHVSAKSEWFQAFLRDDPRYRDWFISVDGSPDLSAVVRPRALPLLTPVETAAGPKNVWTTFSADQVDLNYANPEVLLEIVRTLLLYVEKGADFIRLDAIAYLWKTIGTTCIHLPQTHAVVRLMRGVLNEVSPGVRLITETNVPHKDNVSYFGDGTNEAQLVYNFALPPLVLHTFRTGSAHALSLWAAKLALPSDQTAFFNYLASHDGIGLNPARGILTGKEIDALVERTVRNGGQVSYKANPDGTQSPYELNINFFDALLDPDRDEPQRVQVTRFMTAQAIMLALAGLPGIYFHSLFGSRGWAEGVRLTGRARTVNRQKLDLETLQAELRNPLSLRGRVFGHFASLLRARAGCPAFRPDGPQRVLDFGDEIFALERSAPDGSARALCLHNITSAPQQVRLPGEWAAAGDLLAGRREGPDIPLSLAPYQAAWLRL